MSDEETSRFRQEAQSYGATANRQSRPSVRSNIDYRDGLFPSYDLFLLAKRNITGWFFYAFSSEPFTVSAISTYIPLLLEQFARKSGVNINDHSIPCTPNGVEKCDLGLFNNKLYVDTQSFALYTFSISVFIQAIVVISVSGLVDMWKTIRIKCLVMLLFGTLGSIFSILIYSLRKDQFYMLALCCIFGNTCYGVVNVVGNSLLPQFASDLVKANEEPNVDYSDTVLSTTDTDKLTTIISGRGSSIGYCGALIVQIISIGLIKRTSSSKDLQIAALFVGLWWLFWQIPMIWLMDDLPDRESVLVETDFYITLANHNNNEDTRDIENNKKTSIREKLGYLKYGWWSLFEALKNVKLLKDVLIFLIGWFIVSDSLTTINSTAVLFSKTELHMSTVQVIVVSILTMINAVIGAYFVPYIVATKMNLQPEKLLLLIICWSGVIPLYSILGFVFDSIGLKHQFEMYLMAMWYGISLGSMSAVSRSVFSLIIPKGQESTFFSLFNVTDKGSSIVGPFLVGLITDKTHNIRYSFFLLLILILLSLPVLNLLDINRAKNEANELSKIEEREQNCNQGEEGN